MLVFYLTIFVTIIMEVIQRFLLQYSTIWGEELARYAFIYLIWIGASYCVKERVHLRIDLILNVVSNKAKGAIYLFCDVIMIITTILSLYYSLETFFTAVEYNTLTHGLRVSKTIFLFAVPLGLFLLSIRIIQNIIKDINTIMHDKDVFSGNSIVD